MPGSPEHNQTADGAPPDEAEFEALNTLLGVLRDLSPKARERVVAAAATFLGISGHQRADTSGQRMASPLHAPSTFSQDRKLSPKEFLFEKRPATDVDRIAALAYYLAHYRGTPHFKTLDLSKLNTEAAQLKFSNAAVAVDNATKSGLLVPASKGAKQLSALGELYVQALPDREAARKAIAHARPKRKGRRDARGNARPDGDGGA